MRSDELQPAIGLNNYIGLAGMLLLGFGMMFQLPIVIFFLALSGMIQIKTIKKLRPLVMIVILTLSALLTPPDVFSQLLMAVPTYLLFELSLLLSSFAVRPAAGNEDEDGIPELAEDSYEDDFFEPEPEPEDYRKYYRSAGRKRKLRYIARR
ncbi:MAG: twin-arginine translocase subunit TatC, partial [Victivallaceae bacterium]|nr:twin-arginine translocase subunit TatC [Victivallaceae bacterium]